MNNGDMPAMPLDNVAESDVGRGYQYDCAGLTKREHFAAMAMQGLCSTMTRRPDEGWYEDTARYAVGYADELLKALSNPIQEEK